MVFFCMGCRLVKISDSPSLFFFQTCANKNRPREGGELVFTFLHFPIPFHFNGARLHKKVCVLLRMQQQQQRFHIRPPVRQRGEERENEEERVFVWVWVEREVFKVLPLPSSTSSFLPLLRLLSSAVAREGEEAASDWSFSLPSTPPFRDSPTFSSKKCVSDAATVKAVSHTHRQQLGFHSLTPFKQKKVNFPPPDFAERGAAAKRGGGGV